MSQHETRPAAISLSHTAIARRYFLPIAGTLVLLTGENIVMVVTPYLLGDAIDGLLAKNTRALWIFGLVSLAGLAIGISRRVYDTRAYGRIYREMATETISKELRHEAPVSQMTARANFVSEFVEYFEIMLPAALTSAVMLLGSIVMLGIISPVLCLGTIAVSVAVALVFFLSKRRIANWNSGLNDEMEQQVDLLSRRDATLASSHFAAIVRWRIRLSDLEARNFGLTYLFAIALIVMAVYVLIAVDGKSAGQAFAALTYVLQFTDSMIILPYTYQEFLRTREIGMRLEGKGEDRATAGTDDLESERAQKRDE
jgi:ABC-type multidrug transport system fused ATPase/permease subunit